MHAYQVQFWEVLTVLDRYFRYDFDGLNALAYVTWDGRSATKICELNPHLRKLMFTK